MPAPTVEGRAAAFHMLEAASMRIRLGLLGLVVLAGQAAAQSDSVSKTLLTRRDAEIGAAALATAAVISHFDPKIYAFFSDTNNAHVRKGRRFGDAFTHINETTLTLGGIAAYGVGRLARSPALTDVAFHTTEAVVTASIASQLIRGPLGRSRPAVTAGKDQYDFHWFQGFGKFNYRAFPSIHSSSGFAAATALVQETRHRKPGALKVVAPVLYGLALTPGLSRMYLGQHWASDVFAGAVMGTMAGMKAVNYSHAHPNRFQEQLVPLSNGIGLSWSRTF
jgi:membrane-associated phospholipid phosphatase